MTDHCKKCMEEIFGKLCGSCSAFNSQDAEENMKLSETAEAAILQDIEGMLT